MDVQLRFLGGTPFPSIHRAFEEAFADYALDMSYMTEEVLRHRAAKNGVSLDCSVGAFSGGRLVGLTLVGIGPWQAEPAAFDAGTGILTAFRGQGLAGRMFDFALPELRRRGVKRFLLEVLRENEPAVRAYQKAGFQVTRSFDCYEFQSSSFPPNPRKLEVRGVETDRLDEFVPELAWLPSWENSFEAIRRIPEQVRLLGAFDGGRCLGLLAYNPTLRWIMAVVVKRPHRRQGIGTGLLAGLLGMLPPSGRPIRMNNVDPSDEATRNLLRKSCFRLFTAQYEMEIPL
jgi:ribosomal protein S18 acetylase RimI-like enzyme